MTQLQIIVGAWFLGAMIILVSVWLLLRDIATHSYYQKKSEDGYMIAEFLSKVTPAFVELVKIENRNTGEFTYKGRKYFVGKEKVQIAYPPGRSKMAQVNMDKCYPNPASCDMATVLYGKPTVSAPLVGAMVEQKDTEIAMNRSAEESSGGQNIKKNWMWVWLGLGILGVLSIAQIIFIVKGQGIQQAGVDAQQAILKILSTAFPGVR